MLRRGLCGGLTIGIVRLDWIAGQARNEGV